MKRNAASPQLLLESIRIQNGSADLLPYHQQRVNRSRKVLFPKSPSLKLAEVVASMELPRIGTYKLRLEYGEKVEKHELVPYHV
ncbi:MAG: chorismate-binding protein, partial [Bacteroidota bacterium]